MKYNLVDQTFYELTVIKYVGKDEKTNKRHLWLCRCSCGNEKILKSEDFKSGHTKSCGCLKSPNDTQIIDKLKNRLLKYSDQIGNCRIWNSKPRTTDYGHGYLNIRNKQIMVHRAAWIAWKGPIPEGMNVLHKCDVPGCINPDHLFLGTQRENIHDMISKKRQQNYLHQPKGSSHPNSLLKESDVLEIRKSKLQKKISRKNLANLYQVSIGCIKDILSRRTWRHI
jgi:hypothetical protein